LRCIERQPAVPRAKGKIPAVGGSSFTRKGRVARRDGVCVIVEPVATCARSRNLGAGEWQEEATNDFDQLGGKTPSDIAFGENTESHDAVQRRATRRFRRSRLAHACIV